MSDLGSLRDADEWQRRDGHEHMVCRDCGAIADVNRVVGAGPIARVGVQDASLGAGWPW